MDTAVPDWLTAHADAPIRYRVAREILQDSERAAQAERALLQHPAVCACLRTLQPAAPPPRLWMEHGSFDDCLENALLKAVQLGLHGGLPQVKDAVGYYLARMEQESDDPRQAFSAILTANLLTLAAVPHEHTRRCLLRRLDVLYRFVQESPALYLTAEERAALRGVPACWKDKQYFIRPELLRQRGFCFPLVYDVVGLHTLYRLGRPDTDAKIDAVMRYLSTDDFHRRVADRYGILAEDNGAYHAMGWDPKFPGWFNPAAYMQSGSIPRLLFFALHAARYPAARQTRWFQDLLQGLQAYRTAAGRYAFPAAWLAEKPGYAVLGSHLSFGENRRKRGWREIESTFYMLLLTGNGS